MAFFGAPARERSDRVLSRKQLTRLLRQRAATVKAKPEEPAPLSSQSCLNFFQLIMRRQQASLSQPTAGRSSATQSYSTHHLFLMKHETPGLLQTNSVLAFFKQSGQVTEIVDLQGADARSWIQARSP